MPSRTSSSLSRPPGCFEQRDNAEPYLILSCPPGCFEQRDNAEPYLILSCPPGCFGSVVAVVLLLPFSYIKAGFFSDLPHLHLVDAKDAFLQMKSSWILALCVVGE